MPFLSSTAAQFGLFPMTKIVSNAPSGEVTSGNATTTMDTTGGTSLGTVAGQDDASGQIPAIGFTFYFNNTNYGNGNNGGIFWCTNNVLHFETGINTITWVANTGKGFLLGNTDRRTNTFYTFPVVTSGNYQILKCLCFYQNIYNDGVANAGKYQIRMIRNTVTQYQWIEVRTNASVATSGGWNVTNGTVFNNAFGSTYNASGPASGTSFVLEGNSTGTTWTFYVNSYMNI